MSSDGVDAINSGPLAIRTYTNSSPYKTVVLENYDYPVPSNYVLITTTNGLLAPSDNIYLSSVRTSTIFSISSVISSLYVSTAQISSLGVCTMSTNVGWVKELSISSINGEIYQPGDSGLWQRTPNPNTSPDIVNSNSGIVYITAPSFEITSATSTLINGSGPLIINTNTNITATSTVINGELNVNGSTIISDYLATNRIQMNNGYISSSGALTLNAPNHIYISSGINDGNASIHLFNNKTVISTGTSYDGCRFQLDNSQPKFNITNFNASQNFAMFTSTGHQLSNNLLVLAPDYVSSSTHYLTIQNDYAGAGGAAQPNVVSQFNMGTLKGTYTWWLTDTENPAGSGGLLATNLQLYSYNYTSIGGINSSKEILRIAPTGDIRIQGNVTIGEKYPSGFGNLSLSGYITTPSTVSTPIIAMSTSIGGNGQITGLSTINNVAYPPPVNGEVPVFGIIMWSGTSLTLPTNWALCDGGTYGGKPTPDLRGRFIMGATYATGTTIYSGSAGTPNPTDADGVTCPAFATGTSGGQQRVILSEPQMPAHRHTYSQYTTTYSIDAPFGAQVTPLSPTVTINNTSIVGGNGTLGSTESHPNMPQYYVLAYIMRYQ
jgi:hypothetical protein